MPIPMWAYTIIGTSFAPSPIDRVIQDPFPLASPTTSAFYLGDTRQHKTEAAWRQNLKNYCAISLFSKTYVRVFPSIITLILLISWLGFTFNNALRSLLSSDGVFDMSTLILYTSFDSFFKKSSWESELNTICLMSLWISWQDLPISMAVSCLSPVRTHTLIFVSIKVAIVSGTRSCSLSSIAEDPTYSNLFSYLS